MVRFNNQQFNSQFSTHVSHFKYLFIREARQRFRCRDLLDGWENTCPQMLHLKGLSFRWVESMWNLTRSFLLKTFPQSSQLTEVPAKEMKFKHNMFHFNYTFKCFKTAMKLYACLMFNHTLTFTSSPPLSNPRTTSQHDQSLSANNPLSNPPI